MASTTKDLIKEENEENKEVSKEEEKKEVAKEEPKKEETK